MQSIAHSAIYFYICFEIQPITRLDFNSVKGLTLDYYSLT